MIYDQGKISCCHRDMPSMQTRGTGRSGSELHDQPGLQLVEPVAQFLM